MTEKLAGWLKQRSRVTLTVAALIYVGLVGLVDCLTPLGVLFAMFYSPAIMLVTWFAGRRSGLVIALASGVSWLITERVASPPDTPALVAYWMALNGLVAFLAVVYLLSTIKELHDQLEDRVAKRTAELKSEIEQRKKLEREVLEISDQEQQRIGHDLHDGLCQHLTATMLASKILHEELAGTNRPQAEQARQITGYIDQAIYQSRAIARGLDPVKPVANGLMSALEELATAVKQMHRVPCVFLSDSPVLMEDHVAATHLYRIAQEAVNNAVKHAQPTRIEIALRESKGNVVLTVRDDGRGLQKLSVAGNGMGLHTMNYRANMIGANLQIRQPAEGGTLVEVTTSL